MLKKLQKITNEEWFNGLSTETKARITHLVYTVGYRDGHNGDETIPLQDIMKWFKQLHEQKEGIKMNNKEVVTVYPMMPTKYSPQKRKELRKFEKELLKGEKIDTEKRINKKLKKSKVILNAGKQKPMTEQEYIQTCTTEQLADVLAKQKCDGCHDEPYDEKYGVCKYCMMKKKEQIMEWLKQPHIIKEK